MRSTDPVIVIHIDEASLTCQDATGDSWDALYLCDIVVGKVFVTSGVEVLRITEGPPQFGGDGLIVYFDDFCTDIIPFRNKCSIPQETDAAKRVKKGMDVIYSNHQQRL